MTPAPSIVSRYSELHQEALRLEVHRHRLAAPCQPGGAMAWRTTRRVRSAASALLRSLSRKALTGHPAAGSVDPAARGSL